MPLPKNAFACNICQKPFNNPTILIKHVEFRHSTEEQTQKSKSGSGPKEKDRISNTNRDPLEIHVSNSASPFEFVPIREILEKNEVGAKTIMDSSSENPANGNIKIEDFNYEDQSLQIEKGNNENMSNTCFQI